MKQIELCDSIIISAKSIIADAEELKAKEDKIRADEREKVFDKIMSFINTSNRGNCDYFIIDQIENYINSNKQ